MTTLLLLPVKNQNPHQMNEPIKVAIVEDLKDVAYTLKELFNLEGDLQCNQVYHDAESAIAFLSKNPVDVVLCDIGLPKASGIEVISQLSSVHPQMTFCMFTVFEEAEKIFSSLKAGAKGYILKHSEPSRIVKSLRELYEGGAPMSPEIARKVINAFTHFNPPIKSETNLGLTSREQELLELMATGLLYKEIANELNITVGTVKQHIHKIYKKLQVNNKTEALIKLRNTKN